MVTGAFGYSGRALAEELLRRGRHVATLTGHPDRPDPFAGRIPVGRLDLDDPDALARALTGTSVLYNTYWVRFDHGEETFERAVARSRRLFEAAAVAGVERIVHVSITQPSADSPLPYFAGKAAVEAALRSAGPPWAILRPAVFFGRGDVLINNIAWLLRRLPVFGVPGRGDYGIQPVHVDDFARLAADHGEHRDEVSIDVVGPELWVYRDLVKHIARAVGSAARVVSAPNGLVLLASRLLGLLVRDVVLTRDEVRGLSAGLLVSHEPPTGSTRLSDWLGRRAEGLGREWANELARHYGPGRGARLR